MAPTPRLLFTVFFAALSAGPALLAGGCAAPVAPILRPAPVVSAADLGPLTDAYGRRRSLALAPAGIAAPNAWYTARNDSFRTVTAGHRSPTVQSAFTRTIDRGPNSNNASGRGRGFGLRDGITTRTIRRSFTETVR